ncbi:MAG TPA: glycosyltransferase N-terminal domain-containing protein, partial [Alphaproteobacteria bacterium]|nr:glycosyltransferase N-terminal domain-containing protein [Alphaproteobacteria bacterium]
MTLALKTYRALSQRSEKLLQKLLQKRLEQGKEDPARLWERMGIAKTPRPEGPLIWLHAASVGEAQSALILIDHLLLTAPEAHILLTTGTSTSADGVGQKLPARCIHQYIPLDHPLWVARFMDHWQPNLALWMESELWPNLIIELSAREIPAALV